MCSSDLLVAAISKGQPLNEQEIKLLNNHQSIADESYLRLIFFIQHRMDVDNSDEEVRSLQKEIQEFNALKNTIIRQSESNQPYSVGIEQWFQQEIGRASCRERV